MIWEMIVAVLATSVNTYLALRYLGSENDLAAFHAIGGLCGLVWIVSLAGGAA